jgi:hypothetical protein
MFGGVIAPAKLPALRQLAGDVDLVVHPPVWVIGDRAARSPPSPPLTSSTLSS